MIRDMKVSIHLSLEVSREEDPAPVNTPSVNTFQSIYRWK